MNFRSTSLYVPLLIVFSFIVGLKFKDFVRHKIYFSLISSFNKIRTERVYKELLCPKDAVALAIFGQSNSANTVKPLASIDIPENLFQYDWMSGKCMNIKNL